MEYGIIQPTFPRSLNIVSGLPDDRKVRVTCLSPLEVLFEGTASFLQQVGTEEVPWHFIWVGPCAPEKSKLMPGPIVNYIADPDRCAQALRIASGEAARLKVPWFNHPDRIIASAREEVSQALQGIPGLIVPKIVRCRPDDPEDIIAATAAGGLRYPVLIRSAGQHGGNTLVRVDGPEDRRALTRSAVSEGDLYVTEFHDFVDEDGLYRRYRLVVVGGDLFLKSVVMGSSWNLHASSRIWNDATITQERQIIETFDPVLAPMIKPATDAIYGRLGLDYFGIDCALRGDGSLLVFEANANMNILVKIPLRPDLWSAGDARIKAALLRLLADPDRWHAVRSSAQRAADA